jgi:hypothetical protein
VSETWAKVAIEGSLLRGTATKRAGEVAELSQRVKRSTSPTEVKAANNGWVRIAEKTNTVPQTQVQEVLADGRYVKVDMYIVATPCKNIDDSKLRAPWCASGALAD